MAEQQREPSSDSERHDLTVERMVPVRYRLPDTRNSITHKFTVDTHEGYMTVGLFEDRKPGELFIKMAKEGSTLGGLMDTVGILTSMLLQHGVELETIAAKLKNTRFEPSGFTKSDVVNEASSIPDYIFRWLEHVFEEETENEEQSRN